MDASIIEALLGALGSQNISQMSKKIKAPEDKTKEAVTEISALLTGALANNTSKKEGAAALANALDKDHDGSILDDLSGYISNYQKGPGNGILDHVLGDKRKAVEKSISRESGLTTAKVSKLLTMVAPIILGIIGKDKKQEGLDIGSLASMLGGQQDLVKTVAPVAINILSQVLGSK
jgi:hypothetical protein